MQQLSAYKETDKLGNPKPLNPEPYRVQGLGFRVEASLTPGTWPQVNTGGTLKGQPNQMGYSLNSGPSLGPTWYGTLIKWTSKRDPGLIRELPTSKRSLNPKP